MYKIKGFKIISIISIIFLIALCTWEYWFYKTTSLPFVLLVIVWAFYVISAIIILVVYISIKNKNEKRLLTKESFVFPIIYGILLMLISISIFIPTLIGIPYFIVAIKTMNKLPKSEKVEENTNIQVDTNESLSILDEMTSENEYDSFTTCEFVSEEKNNDNKTNKVTFWIITLIYVLTIVFSIISLFNVKILWNNSEMNKVTGAWLIAFLPSYGLYLFLLSPFNFKSFKIIGTIISIVLMLLADIFPIILLVKYKDVLLLIKEGEMFGLFSSFTFLLISIIISEIGIISLSLLSLVSFNPDKIKNKKNNYNSKLKEPFYIFIFKLLIGIIIGLFNSSLALIRLKEKHINIYSVLIILICSYLCCVLSEILMILFVIFIIGFVIMIMAKMYNMGSQSQTKREVKAKFSNGKEITLTQTIATDVWYDNKNHRWKEEGLGNFTRID